MKSMLNKSCSNCKYLSLFDSDPPCNSCILFNNWEYAFHEHASVQVQKTTQTKEPTVVKKTLDERGKRYGSFMDNAIVTQRAEEVFKDHTPGYWDSELIHREALHMILQKLSRAFCGDVNYLDSWVDVVGYAQLVVDYIESMENENK